MFLTGAASPTANNDQLYASRVVSGDDKNDVFADQAMKISKALAATANSSRLCEPRRNLSPEVAPFPPKATPAKAARVASSTAQKVNTNASPATILPPTNSQIFAAMGNANPSKQGGTSYQAPSFDPVRLSRNNSRNSSPTSTLARQTTRSEVNAATTPYSNNSSPKSPAYADKARAVQHKKIRSTSTVPANRSQRSPSIKLPSYNSSSPFTPKRAVNRSPVGTSSSINSPTAFGHKLDVATNELLATMVAAVPVSISSQAANRGTSGISYRRSQQAAPFYLQRSFGPSTTAVQYSSVQSDNLQSADQVARPDSTDVVARRMVSQALGINIAKKEDARSMAIDAALKENFKGGKNSCEDVKSGFVADDHKQKVKDHTMEFTEETIKGMAEYFFNEGVKAATEEISKLTAEKNDGAFMNAWKTGKIWNAQE